VVRIPASEGVLARATAIMRVLCESGEDLSISHIAEVLGITRSSVHRLLDDLVRARWVERTVHHRYRVAFEFYRIGALGAHRITAVTLAKPLLAELTARCNETAVLAMLVPGELKMVLTEQADPAHPLRWRFQHHIPRSLVWGAPGRAMLAFLDEEQQRSAIAEAPPSPRGRPPPAWSTWKREAEAIRVRNFAMSDGQFTEWAIAYAVPVFGHAGLVGSVAFVVPRTRMETSSETQMVGALQRAAATLSRSLGAPISAAPEPGIRHAKG
jgi:IclR family transcriptional regulator, acetate operon repressor